MTNHELQESHEQLRLEKAITWLLGILCVAQLLSLPESAMRWWLCYKANYVPAFAFRTRSTSLYEFAVEIIGRLFAQPILAITFAITSFLLLRKMLSIRLLLLLTCLLVANQCFVIVGNEIIKADWDAHWETDVVTVASIVAAVAIRTFPMVLLIAILPRRGVRYVGAGAIWWLTVISFLLVALPAVLQWSTDPLALWLSTSHDVFSIYNDGNGISTIVGLGTMVGVAASFITVGAIPWTIWRGHKGRTMLMVCAALMTICFFTTIGAKLISESHSFVNKPVYRTVTPPLPTVPTIDRERLLQCANDLAKLAAALAFPLAIRMALSLSAVRTYVDGKTVPAA